MVVVVVVVVVDVVVLEVVVVVVVELSSAASVCGLVIVVAVLLVVLSCVDVAKMLDAGCGIWLHVFQSKSRWNVVQHVPIVYAIKVVLWI